MNKKGLLIAGIGLPGAGKSTVLAALAHKNGWRYLAEPEEQQWPLAVEWQSVCGVFTALTWFRAMRVPNLYRADQFRNEGDIVLLDSYYDKLMRYYIDEPQTDWLVSKKDAYYELIRQMALIDNHNLPEADIMVFFHVSFEAWEKMIMSRKRQLDIDRVFPDAFPFQKQLLSAARMERERSGTHLLVFENQFSSVNNTVSRLDELIVGLLHRST